MGTSSKNSCKTAAVMSLLSKGPSGKGLVSNLGTSATGPSSALLADDRSGGLPTAREQIEYIDIDHIDDDPNNFYELSGLDELAANIELLGLQQPIRVRPGAEQGRYIIVSGHRRRAAVQMLVDDGREELRELPCIVEREQGSAALQELRLIYANSDTRKMTSADISRQAERVETLLYQLKEEGYEFPGRMRDHVAEACKVSKSKLARLKVIRENLAPCWQKRYEAGRLAESAAYALAQMPGDRQQVISDGLAKQGNTSGSVYESTVEGYGRNLAQVDKLECKTYGTGPCLNRENMRERIMSKDSWSYSYCTQCCDQCTELVRCKYACSMLTDKVKQLKSDAKAQNKQAKQAAEERERPQVEQIQEIWRRFGEARAAAGKSLEDCFNAAGRYFADADVQKFEKLERLEGKFSADTRLPYGYSCCLSEVRRYVAMADLLGVSLDYLLCRTDDPAGLAPQPEGQLVLSGWMPGGTTPHQPCDVVLDYEIVAGVIQRTTCKFDGKDFCRSSGLLIDGKPVRWMVLPPVLEESAP